MDQDDTKDDKNVDGAAMLSEFDEKLMRELGLDKLPEDEQKKAREDLDSLINTRIINLAMIYVPEEKLQEFKDLAVEADGVKISAFLNNVVPNWNDKVLSEIMQIRDELLGK